MYNKGHAQLMELTLDVLNDLFPHSGIEPEKDKYLIKAPWCNVTITFLGADMELLKSTPPYWSFNGPNWEEKFIDKIIEFESMAPFFLVGQVKQGSIHLKTSYYTTRPGHIRDVGNTFCSVWRGWNNQLVLCSQQFHRRYL